MYLRRPLLFSLSDLQQLDPERNRWFNAKTPQALAGRCLVDILEYLRADPRYPGRFRHVTNAHAIRLACQLLSDQDLKGKDVLDRLQRHIKETCSQLRENRNNDVPYYGDDFWDWASVLEAFVMVQQQLPCVIDAQDINRELRDFYDSVKAHVSTGLTKRIEGEWYGPAIPTIAYRLLSTVPIPGRGGIREVCDDLRKQALDLITDDYKYQGRDVLRHHVLWHYGQVVATFGKEAAKQSSRITDLSALGLELEKSDRAYALARVLQGAQAIGDEKLKNEVIDRLYACESPARPIGQGLIADNPKGSLNVLEALWPGLDSEHRKQLRSMTDALLQCNAIANTVGIVVAIENEFEAVTKTFISSGATLKQKGKITVLEHPDYYVVARRGKSLASSLAATKDLIEKDKAKWVIMVGVAGSLGRLIRKRVGKGKAKKTRKYFHGPRKGDVVVAAAVAPYRIRDKVRDNDTARAAVENAGVPFEGSAWMIAPTDPGLFRLAHEAGDELFGEAEPKRFYEGLIITGTGIKDAAKEKRKILEHFPSGLAVEEEGYLMALLCMTSEIPYLNIRGISDLAQGDKRRQKKKPGIEKKEQRRAAVAAAQLTVRVVKQLSREW